jgi:hypothetical protein
VAVPVSEKLHDAVTGIDAVPVALMFRTLPVSVPVAVPSSTTRPAHVALKVLV